MIGILKISQSFGIKFTRGNNLIYRMQNTRTHIDILYIYIHK